MRLRALRAGDMLGGRVWGDLRQPELGRHYQRFRSDPAMYLLTAEPTVRDRIWRLVTGRADTATRGRCPYWLVTMQTCAMAPNCACTRSDGLL